MKTGLHVLDALYEETNKSPKFDDLNDLLSKTQSARHKNEDNGTKNRKDSTVTNGEENGCNYSGDIGNKQAKTSFAPKSPTTTKSMYSQSISTSAKLCLHRCDHSGERG